MDALLHWFGDNWFTLLQGLGIVAGLLFTAASLRQDAKSRRVSDLLSLTEQHRELWSEIHRRPELGRILQAEVDLVASPVTFAEEFFLNTVIVHFNTGWLLARQGALLTIAELAKDIGSFFSLPIPKIVWEQTKRNRDPSFVRFVQGCLPRKRTKRAEG